MKQPSPTCYIAQQQQQQQCIYHRLTYMTFPRILQIGKAVRQNYSEWVDQHVPDDKYATAEIDAEQGYCHELGALHLQQDIKRENRVAG